MKYKQYYPSQINKENTKYFSGYNHDIIAHRGCHSTKNKKYRTLLDVSNLSYKPIDFTNKRKKIITIKSKKGKRTSITLAFQPPLLAVKNNQQKEQKNDCSRAVKFDDDVKVVKIRSHRDYSLKSKQKMWNSPHDIHVNAKRNFLEFHADGKNWRNCAEEDLMWYDYGNHEFVHPVHIPEYLKMQQYYARRTYQY